MAPRRTQRLPPTLTFRIDPKARKHLRKLADDKHMSEGSLVALFVDEGLSQAREGTNDMRLRNVEHDVACLQLEMRTVRTVIGLPESTGQSAPQHKPATDADDSDEPEPEHAEPG